MDLAKEKIYDGLIYCLHQLGITRSRFRSPISDNFRKFGIPGYTYPGIPKFRKLQIHVYPGNSCIHELIDFFSYCNNMYDMQLAQPMFRLSWRCNV